MKRLIVMSVITIIAMAFGIPLLVLSGSSEPGTQGIEAGQQTVRVYDKLKGKITIVPLEEYLVGVVAAEMPAKFEKEALKAQAVAARTYTIKRMFAYGGKPQPGHPQAEVCTDPAHCQAWTDTAEQKKRWGNIKYYINIERIRAAVKETKGMVITYNNQFIDPVYHGSCGGQGTENSEDVWSTRIPYLRGVKCDKEYRGGEQKKTIEVDKKDLAKALAVVNPAIRAVPAMAVKTDGEVIKPAQKSPQGRIMEARINGQKVSGTDLRRALGLTSTLLEIDDKGASLMITSIGKGHAVGLCQYGANGLAITGKTFKEILQHYYTGIKIQKLN